LTLTRTAAAVVVAAASVCAVPATAQQSAPGGARPAGRQLVLQPPPADFGSPPISDPRLTAGPEPKGDCAPAWRCRLRLFGVIGKNGGVGLKGAALTW
jgi:hypothetical protein